LFRKKLVGYKRGNVKVIAPPNRKYLSWQGASLFATFPDWDKYTTHHDEYLEKGAENLAREFMYT